MVYTMHLGNKRISIRFDEKMRLLLDKYAKNRGIRISELITNAIMDYLMNNPEKDDKLLEEVKRIHNKKHILSKIKRDMHDLYFMKNTCQKIMNIALTNYKIGIGNGIEKIILIVENAESLFYSFPPEIQEILKDDLAFIKSLKNEKNLDIFKKRVLNYERLLK